MPGFSRIYQVNRTQFCQVNEKLFHLRNIITGIPRASIPKLGPLLFLIYVNGLPNCLNDDECFGK